MVPIFFVRGMSSVRKKRVYVDWGFHRLLPERFTSDVNFRTVFARKLAGFIRVKARKNRFGRATRFYQSAGLNLSTRNFLSSAGNTFVFQIPFIDLPEEFLLIVLIQGPAHMENVWLHFSFE